MAFNTDQQPAPVDPLVVRDRLRQLFSLLGIRTRVELTTYGLNRAVVLNPLSVPDADKLGQALQKLPELRPYIVHRRPPVAGGEAGPR